mmetsp:Transcript_60794/g.131890  ORF Transcript_60794/g.131890 Transcript_60794/m.131890 type:complete len:266 (+) Transcript_60794:161-958(+)
MHLSGAPGQDIEEEGGDLIVGCRILRVEGLLGVSLHCKLSSGVHEGLFGQVPVEAGAVDAARSGTLCPLEDLHHFRSRQEVGHDLQRFTHGEHLFERHVASPVPDDRGSVHIDVGVLSPHGAAVADATAESIPRSRCSTRDCAVEAPCRLHVTLEVMRHGRHRRRRWPKFGIAATGIGLGVGRRMLLRRPPVEASQVGLCVQVPVQFFIHLWRIQGAIAGEFCSRLTCLRWAHCPRGVLATACAAWDLSACLALAWASRWTGPTR